MPESARDWCLPGAGVRSPGIRPGLAPGAGPTVGDFSKPLPAGREEAAKETALAQFRLPRMPGLGGCAQPLEDPGHFARDRRLAIAE